MLNTWQCYERCHTVWRNINKVPMPSCPDDKLNIDGIKIMLPKYPNHEKKNISFSKCQKDCKKSALLICRSVRTFFKPACQKVVLREVNNMKF